MAKVQNPITGRSAGKYGNAVFTTWKGINVLKTKPLEVANPKSAGQVNQRGKFSSMVMYARMLLGLLQLSMKSLAVKRSEFNAFISQNIALIDPTTFKIDTNKVNDVQVSSGTIQGYLGLAGLTVGNISGSFTFATTGYYSNTSPNDFGGAVLYNQTKDTFSPLTTTGLRSDGEIIFDTGSIVSTGDTVSVYAFLYNDKNEYSTSQWVGTVIVS